PASPLSKTFDAARLLCSTGVTRFLATRSVADAVSSSADFPGEPVIRLLCSTDFSMGRGRFLQLLDMSLSPCCPYHPAEVPQRIGQLASYHTAFAPTKRARPPGSFVSRPPVGSLSLRPGDSLTPPTAPFSVGF